jgi:hypothetical protein
LHAGYNALALTRDLEHLTPLETLVEWQVKNSQPDHTTAEPWALAAFAALDPTGTFAQDQLHAVQANASGGPQVLTLALLADALLTQEEA